MACLCSVCGLSWAKTKKRQQEITNQNKKATTTPKEAGDALFNSCGLCLLKIYHNRFWEVSPTSILGVLTSIVSFKIGNRNYQDDLQDPRSARYKDFQSILQGNVSKFTSNLVRQMYCKVRLSPCSWSFCWSSLFCFSWKTIWTVRTEQKSIKLNWSSWGVYLRGLNCQRLLCNDAFFLKRHLNWLLPNCGGRTGQEESLSTG